MLDDCGAVRRYEFPAMGEAGTPIETWDDDNPLAESMAYLDERRALLGTGEGRIFLVDTASMTIEGEVELGGHEPRTTGEYYPALAKERGLGTDIQYFAKLGGVIVFVYRRDRGDDLEGWQDSLVWASADRASRSAGQQNGGPGTDW